MEDGGFEFTHFWDGRHIGLDIYQIWDAIRAANANPSRILEIGAFEGRSTCKMIALFAAHTPIALTCIDTWEGAIIHTERVQSEHEERFDRNVALAIGRATHPVEFRKIKADSFLGLASLVHHGESGTFDWIYLDASHKASDVLGDAVAAFRLLKSGGILVFDDYLWTDPLQHGGSVMDTPKPAIDAFINLHFDQLTVVSGAGLWQMYIRKH
jgi:predicted O-methyltransferase YrrM